MVLLQLIKRKSVSSDKPIIYFCLTGIADTAWTASRTEFAKIGLASTTDDDEITFYASAYLVKILQ